MPEPGKPMEAKVLQDISLSRKITAPVLPRTFLRRPALVAHLREAIARETRDNGSRTNYRLVLLCAPAGYGKTTLLADFAHTTQLPSCWYFLDHTDVDSTIFLRTLFASVRQTFPHFGQALDHFFLNGPGENLACTESMYQSALDALCSALATEIRDHFALYLCNYEEINESESLNRLVTHLLKSLPAHVTLVIESRVMPDIPLLPLFVHEEVAGLDRDSLRFSTGEIFELARLYGLTAFTEAEAEQLAVTFDGWITGILLGTRLGDLRLYPFRQQRLDNDLDVIDPHKRSVTARKQQNLFAYIVNEVFQQDMTAYTFLQAAALLREMEPAMCNSLLDITDAAECLARLEHNNLFVVSYHNGAELIYTCHPVIRDLLCQEFRQQEPQRFTLLQRKAAELWQARRNYDQALYHAFEAGATDLAVQLIFEAYKQLLQQKHLDTLMRWLERLPAETRESNPRLLLIQATLLLARGLHSLALPVLDKAALLVEAGGGESHAGEVSLLQIEVDILRSKVLFQAGDYVLARTVCQQALLQLPNDEIELRAAAEMRLGLCANLLGDFSAGLLHLQQALAIWSNQLPLHQAADIHGALANTYYLMGNFALAEHHLARALNYCEQLHDEYGKVDNLIRKGLLRLYQGSYAQAEEVLLQALELARTSLHDQRCEAYALANLGSVYIEQAMYTQALTCCEDSLLLAYQCGNRSLVNATLSNMAITHLLMGDTSSALLFAQKMTIQAGDEQTISYEYVGREITYGMIEFYQGRYDEAYTRLARLHKGLNANSLRRVQLQVKLRLAACQLARQRQAEAVHLLEEIVDLFASNDGYKQLVHVELRWQPALLQTVKSLPRLARLREILELPADEPRAAAASQSVSGGLLVQPRLSRLSIRAFGEPVVFIDDQPVRRWRMARAMELFFFLLESATPLSKEQIITALWPQFDEQINQTFHSTLHHLRKLIGESCLLFRANGYSLNLAACYGENVWYDVQEFQTLHREASQALVHAGDEAARKAFLRMVELYQGDYGRPFYSDWCTLKRDELCTLYLEAQRQLAHIAWRQQAYDECVHHWRQLLRRDNCQEEAHYGIMLCYLRQEKRSAALRQYHACKETLQQELGLQPGGAIEKLYQRLVASADLI